MASASAKKLAAELSALAGNSAQLETERGRQIVSEALASHQAEVTAHAARLVAEHTLGGFERELRAAFRAFMGERASSTDPGALAKEVLLRALDAVEDGDAELFAEAACYVQLERAKGGLRDRAAGVRARGVLALARVGRADLIPILGACLGDRDATVRLSASRAVAHRGQRDGAGLLLLRLGAGDDSSEIEIECIKGLFAVASDLGLRYARAALEDPQARNREHVLHALGTAAHDAAIELLADELARHSLADARVPIIEAIGLSVRSPARSVLLELVQSERRSDAEAALSALAIHRYDARLRSQLEELTAGSPELARRVRDLFGAD